MDDEFAFKNDQLYFSDIGENQTIWGPILEKAWAKMKGSYSNADGGFVHSGIRALVGCPVFGYKNALQTSYTTIWTFLKAADEINYILGSGTGGTSDQSVNECGIATGHAFSIISLFEMNGLQMMMLRNPWGFTKFSGDWSHSYSNWT